MSQSNQLTLKHRIFRAGGWAVFGYGTIQLLRFAGNLILTRLLFPEAFGLMAIVQAVMVGLNMMSDVGIEQSIIHNKKGNEPVFVNTAWTVKVVRGVLMWIALWVLADPLALFYGEPILAQLLPVVGVSAVIAGLGSTNIAMADRNLGIAKTTIIDVGSYGFGLIVTVVFAWIDRSIWSLVIGNIAGTAAKTVASHVWLDGIRNRFFWEAESLGALLTFGRWIFVGSALTFLAGEGSRLLIG
ncbi:MAG: oligosaccharide flippase family protein, partial [Giesbergeria sp.]